MKQSRLMSMLEAVISTAIGFGISLAAQVLFLPMLGVTVSISQNVNFALIMTVISIIRQFVMRRVFEALHIRKPLSPFIQAVVAERIRQVEVEGWDAAHDDAHTPGELAIAGAAYARQAHLHLGEDSVTRLYVEKPRMYVPNWWPWDVGWWKPKEFRRDLVRACALIVAEGDTFDRHRKPGRGR